MMWFRDSLEVARQSLMLQLSRRMILLGVIGVTVFGVLIGLMSWRAAPGVAGDNFLGSMIYFLLFQFVLPLVAVYMGVSAVNADIEDGTFTYLFVRPVRRTSLLFGKWLSAALLGWLWAALVIAVIWLAVAGPSRPWYEGRSPSPGVAIAFIGAAALATPAYAAVGAFFGAFFRRPLVFTMLFVVGWEVIISNTPPQAWVRGATVADPVRRWLMENLPQAGELREALGWSSLDFLDDPAKLGDPVWSVARFTLILLCLAVWVYTRREYDSRPRD